MNYHPGEGAVADRERHLGKVIDAKDAYIRLLRQRVYGRADGTRPSDEDLNAASCKVFDAERDAAVALVTAGQAADTGGTR